MNFKRYIIITVALISIAPAFASAGRNKKLVKASCDSLFALMDNYNECLKDGAQNCRSEMNLATQEQFKALGIKWLVIRIARCKTERNGILMSPLATSLSYEEPEITNWLKRKMKRHGFKCHLKLFNEELKRYGLQPAVDKNPNPNQQTGQEDDLD